MSNVSQDASNKTDLVHVTRRPALSNGELNRNVIFLIVSPTPRRVIHGPVIVQAVVKGCLVAVPAVISGF